MQRTVICVSKEAIRPNRRNRRPYLFGRGGRDRVLCCLAVNGPMTVREIGRAIGSDSHKTFTMVERLQAAGLVVKRDLPGGRKYVAINKRLRIYRPLLRLLKALDRHWPVPRIQKVTLRKGMWTDDGTLDTDRLDNAFFSPVRSRVLLFVSAVGMTDLQTIYDLQGLGSVSASYAVNHWEREGIMRSSVVGRHRVISLDPEFEAAAELKALLREMVIASPEYRVLRRIARERLKPVLTALDRRER